MKVRGTEPVSGKTVETDIFPPDEGFFTALSSFDMSDASIRRMIDNLNISADTKSLLYQLAKCTLLIGDRIVKVGRKIIDSVCELVRQFPTASFGAILGGIAGTLITSIPIIGQILGPIVTAILMALGIVVGGYLDFRDKLIDRKIAERVAEFAPLAKQNAK
jgi:hypothetical protein